MFQASDGQCSAVICGILLLQNMKITVVSLVSVRDRLNYNTLKAPSRGIGVNNYFTRLMRSNVANGIEPTTFRLQARRPTARLPRHPRLYK